MSHLLPFFRRKAPADAAQCIARFLRRPEHQWISSHRALRDRITGFLSQVPASDLEKILEERRLLLLYCNQKLSCAFYQYEGREVVLVFPELRRLLLSAQYLQAYAVLAHEFGHVLLGHSRKAIPPLEAQLEADRYAAELGFGEELAFALQEETNYEEVLARIQALRG